MLMIIKEKTVLDPNLEFVKVVIDIEKEILSAMCELHIDCYEELIKDGSKPKGLWGANVNLKTQTIAFVSMINIRPGKNDNMEIKDENVRTQVEAIIRKLIF